MTTIVRVIEESFKNAELSTVSTSKLVDGLKVLQKTRTLLIPMGLTNRMEKVVKISCDKNCITLFTKSDRVVIRNIDLKHQVNLFQIL